MYEITKEINFSYGHRVWSQELNSEFSVDNECKCKFLHGHNGTIKVSLGAENVNEQGMVTDFKHLNWLKVFIDDVIDHKFIVDMNDPLFVTMFPVFRGNDPSDICERFPEGYWKLHPGALRYRDASGRRSQEAEIYDGLVIVDFIPTSENFAKWIFDLVQVKMKELSTDFEVTQVEFFETPKTRSVYHG